jgi:hypothetical protein
VLRTISWFRHIPTPKPPGTFKLLEWRSLISGNEDPRYQRLAGSHKSNFCEEQETAPFTQTSAKR